jgi:hypothetical protein
MTARSAAVRAGDLSGPSTTQQSFYPSLHLNLADNCRRFGSFAAASRHLDEARRRLGVLADDAYGQTMRAGIDHIAAALATARHEERTTPSRMVCPLKQVNLDCGVHAA